jgi:hypothetical protein
MSMSGTQQGVVPCDNHFVALRQQNGKATGSWKCSHYTKKLHANYIG